MSKYPGRRISATPPSVSTSAASGVWTLEEVMQYRQAGTWPVGVAGADPNFNQTVLLLHGDGNQGANNLYNPGPPRYLAFTDNSDNNFPITVNGDAYGDNFSPFMTEAGQWSNYFDGTNDFLTTPSNSAFDFGTGDFTVEFWAYVQATSGFAAFVGNRTGDATSTIRWGIYIDSTSSSLTTEIYSTSNTQIGYIIFQSTFPRNQWVHCALVRSGTSFRLYQNGVQSSSSITSSAAVANSSTAVRIGDFDGSVVSDLNGYLSNLRIVKGRAVYTSAFTPPTTPLGATSGGQNPPQNTETSLLTCQSNRFVDNGVANSGTGFTITRNGDVSVKPFNPFTTTYSSTNGSGYFDGTDNLSIPSSTPNQFGSGDFTLEAWVNPTIPSPFDGQHIFFRRTTTSQDGLIFGINGSQKAALISGDGTWRVTLASTTTIANGQWYHLAATRSGSTWTLYVNGVAEASTTASFTISQESANITIGTGSFTGYISGWRAVKGQALTSGAFTPPTGPVTTSTIGWTGANVAASLTGSVAVLTLQYQGSVRNVGFIDSSPYDHVITRNPLTGPNAPTQGTFSPFSVGAGEWSNYFGGDGNYLSTGYNAGFDFGTGDFSIECMAYVEDAGRGNDSVKIGYFISAGQTNSTTNFWGFGPLISDGVISEVYFGRDNLAPLQATGQSITLNAWHHFVLCRTGTTLSIFVDGTRRGTTTYSTAVNMNTSGSVVVNRSAYGGSLFQNWLKGYTSNIRVIKGSHPYDATSTTLTPPTSGLSSATNTVLLTCQGNRFFDANTQVAAKTITVNGSPRVTPFSPFAPTAAYSAGTNGGSGYFDGTGDYLSGIGATGFFNFLHNSSALFTVQAWVYLLATGSSYVIFDTTNNSGSSVGAVLNINSSNQIGLVITTGNAGQFVFTGNSTGAITPNAWNHIAVTYNQSLANTNAVFYINGVQSGTGNKTAVAPSSSNATYPLAVGGSATGANSFNGYIANLRIDNSVESIAVPTAPIGNVATSRLLLNFTNAGIFDQTGKNVLETVGNAQIDTTVKKYGTGSMKFDGTGDWLKGVTNENTKFGTGDYTIEMWIYPTSSNLSTLFDSRSTNPATDGLSIFQDNTGLDVFSNAYIINTSGVLTLNSWQHIAVVRSSGTLTAYVNGVSVGSAANTDNHTAGRISIGVNAVNTNPYTGYIDDLRITKGVARYPTEPFPTAPFPDQ